MNRIVDVLESMNSWRDSEGLLVCKPVDAPPNREDSCHKAGHLAAIIGMLGLPRLVVQDLCNRYTQLFRYQVGGEIVRHPFTAYTTSRDQVIPWMIGRYLTAPYCNKHLVQRWLRECKVQGKWSKFGWLIGMFYHTPNGDVFQPDHTAVVLRTKFHVGELDRVRITLGDIWMCLDVITKLPQQTNRHWVNLVLMMEFARRVRPTIFSEFAHRLFVMFHSKQKVYNEYFSGSSNPPIGTLYSEIQVCE